MLVRCSSNAGLNRLVEAPVSTMASPYRYLTVGPGVIVLWVAMARVVKLSRLMDIARENCLVRPIESNKLSIAGSYARSRPRGVQ